MKYNINFKNHANFKVYELNKLEPRAYFVPFSAKSILEKTDFRKERYESDMLDCLSGEWGFKFYKQYSKMPAVIDTLRMKFDSVHVPSVWQREGHYEEPVYLNCPYQFKTLPPEVPEDMPCGVYRKEFMINGAEKTHRITFLGVANNIGLYVNGQFVGYSEGSHNTAEFDITPYIKNGLNELLAVSFKWCNGSFLEAQDFFRENGIFRDVYITKQPDAFLWDFKLETPKSGKTYDLNIEAMLCGDLTGTIVNAALFTKDGKLLCEDSVKASEAVNFSFKKLNVEEWNAEIPTLYDLYLSVVKEGKELMCLRNFTGFKTVEIQGEVFLFNGANIKMKGVNHHDTHPVRGYAMTLEDLEDDIKLMKSLNVNTVRTSHYPSDPFFLILADVYGCYVVDEADIETHGLHDLGLHTDWISMDMKWAKHYLDRVKRMYYRDRNRACITMWSLGNEAGGYKCHDVCYKYLHEVCPQIPVHYEGVVRTKRHSYDVISEMYTSIPVIRDMLKHKRTNNHKVDKRYFGKPFYFCEYCHAMGFGPGNLEEYWEVMYAGDQFMGGCIWEWADHSVFHGPEDKKYKYKYTYGGDHGEKQHDGNFCVDALVYPDRTPHTGAYEMQVVYRPIRAKSLGNGMFEFLNTNRFRNADYLKITWELLENGLVIDSGELKKLDLAPKATKQVEIKHKEISEEKDYHLNLSYFEDGNLMALEQLVLNDVEYEFEFEIGDKISAEIYDNIITVKFDNGFVKFSDEDGQLLNYCVDKKEYINQTPAGNVKGFLPNLWRAFLDNDHYPKRLWKQSGLDKMKSVAADIIVELDNAVVNVYVLYELKVGKKVFYNVDVNYAIWASGAMDVTASLEVASDDAPVDLARFGLTLELAKELDNVKYYGRGEKENLPDIIAQSPMGIYSSTVKAMHEPYIYPQDNGDHCETKWLELSDKKGRGLTIYAYDKFAFSVHDYTQESLEKAKHQEDLKDENTVFLSLDSFQRGSGSCACGPDTLDEYKRDASMEELVVSFTIIPN